MSQPKLDSNEDDDTNTDDAVTFVAGVTDTTPNGNNVTVTLDALSMLKLLKRTADTLIMSSTSLTVADAAANSSHDYSTDEGHAFDFWLLLAVLMMLTKPFRHHHWNCYC